MDEVAIMVPLTQSHEDLSNEEINLDLHVSDNEEPEETDRMTWSNYTWNITSSII